MFFSMKPAELAPAPKRGQYDRGLSRPERQAAQRERVVVAITALVGSKRALNVANVVELAGIGRNTFYEYFDDIEHALVSIKARALHDLSARLELALQDARTPLERIGALTRAWTEHLFEVPALAQTALRAQSEVNDPTHLSALAEHVMNVLSNEVAARSTFPGLNEPLRVLVVSALFDTVSRSHLGGCQLTADELQRVLSDLSQRLLR